MGLEEVDKEKGARRKRRKRKEGSPTRKETVERESS